MDAGTVGLLTGGIGVAGTLAGVVFTQWRSDMRERQRLAAEERREDQRLAREARREQDARLFDYRRSAYIGVVEQFHRWSVFAASLRQGHEFAPAEDAMDNFWRAVSEVDLYGSAEAAAKALDLYQELHTQVFGPSNPNIEDGDLDAEVIERHNEFLNAARADLGLPPRWPDRLDLIIGSDPTA